MDNDIEMTKRIRNRNKYYEVIKRQSEIKVCEETEDANENNF